jgi:hypothetical protein
MNYSEDSITDALEKTRQYQEFFQTVEAVKRRVTLEREQKWRA